jgi:multidrug/hemolysin transport system permease protein
MIELVYRHIRYFVRDRSRVFFSFLSVIVLILLYKVFLEYSLLDSVMDFVRSHNVSISNADMKILDSEIDLWLIGGLLTVNCMSNALGAFGVNITDRERGRIKDFSITSCPASTLFLSYIISAIIITFVFTVLLFFVGMLVFASPASLVSLGPDRILAVVVAILLCSVFSACLFFPIILNVSNNQTFSIISTIFGTFGGFFTGTYIPIGNLPVAVEKIVTWFPLTHFAEFFRSVLTSDSTDILAKDIGPSFKTGFNQNLGISLYNGDSEISPSFSFIYLSIWFAGAVLLILHIARMHVRRK